MKQKTYRVPKKVSDSARTALGLLEHIDLKQGDELHIAQALASGIPVGPNVLMAVDAFFSRRPRGRMDVAAALMHGGTHGRDWANRCVTLSIAPTKSKPGATESFDDMFEITDTEYEAMIEFSKELADAAGVESKIPDEGDSELAMGDPGDLEAESTDPVDELGEHVETALGLATQLDETIEKLAAALDEALEDPALTEDAEEETEPYDEVEMSMVTSALAEVGADVEDMDADFAVMAAEARERMAAATLAHERGKAMAKMASARLTLQAEGAGPIADVVEKAADAPADAGPKAPGPEHHAKRQVRDWHGRFAKAGARVRSESGNLGYIKKVDENGQLVITDDDGNEHTVDPKSIEVISKKSPARLSEPMALVEDPKVRMDAYLEWSKDQMGAGG